VKSWNFVAKLLNNNDKKIRPDVEIEIPIGLTNSGEKAQR
jgi:hypothetical protein